MKELERVQITDDLGNTNAQVNDYFELGVPNVTYTLSEDDGLFSHDIIMPISRQYTLKFHTETDTVDINFVKGIGNASLNYAVRYTDLQLPSNVECLLTINSQGMEDLRYDSNGDGNFDTVVPAHVRVSGTAAQDVTAPSVKISYSELVGDNRTVTINVADSQSGIRTIYYRLGTTGNFQVYTAPFPIQFAPDRAAPIIVEAFADDNAGNRSSPIRVEITKY